jgi:predicted RNA-binding Zn ribbon-like protein
MADKAQHDAEFRDGMPFLGGRVWLDLLNTTPVDGGVRRDFLGNPEGCGRWLAAAELPQAASGITALRDVLQDCFDRLAGGEPLRDTAVAAVNRHLAGLQARVRLVEDGSLRRLERQVEGDALALIADDFARFACEADPSRLRRCADPACTMVFHDTSKNGTRRWCSMAVCGNRDKVARYRARRAKV